MSVLGVLVFWVGVFVAGGLVNGYSAREDYISVLAARGSPVAVLVISALLANAVAHLATAAAVALVAVAVFRQSCPAGLPRCGLANSSAADWVDVVHGVSVGVYELFTLAAMLTLTIGAFRRNSAPPRWLGWVSLAFAAGSVALGVQSVGDHSGMWQRLWLANNLVWLLLVAWTATVRERAISNSGGIGVIAA